MESSIHDDSCGDEVHSSNASYSELQGGVSDTPVVTERNHSSVSDTDMTFQSQQSPVKVHENDMVVESSESGIDRSKEIAPVIQGSGPRRSNPGLKIALNSNSDLSPTTLNHPVTPIYEDSDSVGFPSPLSSPNTSRNSHTDSPGRASSRLASPVGFYTRSRSSTNDSRASGSIDGRSYFNGPEDKLVSRLVNRFNESGESQSESTMTVSKTRTQKKKVDHSFLQEDNSTASKTLNRKKSRPSSLRVSSKENVKKHWQAVDGSDGHPPMPDSAPGALSFWSNESTEYGDEPVSPRSVGKAHSRLSNREDSDVEVTSINTRPDMDQAKQTVRESFDFGRDDTSRPYRVSPRKSNIQDDLSPIDRIQAKDMTSPTSNKSDNRLKTKESIINEDTDEESAENSVISNIDDNSGGTTFDFESETKTTEFSVEDTKSLPTAGISTQLSPQRNTEINLENDIAMNGKTHGKTDEKSAEIEEDDSFLPSDEADNLIFGVCVVGFHHAKGPEVEYWIGPEGDMSGTWPYLAFQCLPDGSHTHEENFCYFTLLYDEEKKIAPNPTPQRDEEGHIVEESDFTSVVTLFGISCNRQLKSTNLKNKTADVTRSTVQKSVVVIARKPIFGTIKDKLAVVTRAYFDQGDFTDRSLVENFYQNLRMMFSRRLSESDLTVGMPIRELLYRLGKDVLVILKALLLERRVLFFASNTELLCASQFSIISLIPDLINHLEDSGSPLLSTYETTLVKANSLKTSNRASLLRYMGLPLQIFAAGGLFSPYVPLQQVDDLKADEAKYFLVGTTNSLLMERTSVSTDIAVDMDAGTVTVYDDDSLAVNISNKKLSSLLSLSTLDKRWMDSLVKAVQDTWDPEDPLRPKDNGFYGTEDYIRMQFEDYIMHMLASVKYDNFIKNGGQVPLVHRKDNIIKLYNADWIAAWKNTNNYRIFDKFTDNEIFDVTEPIHIAQETSEETESGNGLAKGVSKVFGGLWKGSSQDNLTTPTNSATGSSITLPGTSQRHRSDLSISTTSSTASDKTPSTSDKPSSRASSYLSGWSSWASNKRKQSSINENGGN